LAIPGAACIEYPQLLTYQQFAELGHMSVRTAWNIVDRQSVTAWQFGNRCVRIDGQDLIDRIEKQREGQIADER
jgi:2-C-methyl-D-erythritol 4-phosphate cytidylyltransferase